MQRLAPALTAYEKRTAVDNARQKEKDRIEAQRVAAENKAKAEAERSQNSPNGLLLQAYQAFQMVQACFDARRGYALVYANDVEFGSAKEKMRQIEAALKPKLAGVTTEQLWNKAATENGNGPSNIKSATLQQGQMVCSMSKGDVTAIANKVLGKEAPRKNF